MANYLTTDTDLTAVANAIRTKGGTNATLTFPSGFVSAINAISTSGGGSSSASISSANFSQFFDVFSGVSTKTGLNFSDYASVLANNEYFYFGLIEDMTDCIAHFQGLTCVDWKCLDGSGNDITNQYEKTDLDSSYFWAVGSKIVSSSEKKKKIGMIVIC